MQDLQTQGNTFYNAGVMVIWDRKVLVVMPIDRMFYLIPGGGIEKDESPIEAALRELEEEVGIELTPEDVADLGVFQAKSGKGSPKQFVNVHTYLYLPDSEPVLEFRDGEVKSIKWVDSTNFDSIPIGNVLKDQLIPLLKNQGIID